MRFYENPKKTYENREKPRAYYIPKGEAKYTLLNGVWNFAFFENSDYATEPKKWDKKWDKNSEENELNCNKKRATHFCVALCRYMY